MDYQELRRFYTGETFYSDWFPRQGDNAIFRAEAIDYAGEGATLTIEFYTKNSDATSSYNGSQIGSNNLTLTADGFDQELIESTTDPAAGLLQLIRCKFSMTVTSAWMLARMLPTVFFDSADAS